MNDYVVRVSSAGSSGTTTRVAVCVIEVRPGYIPLRINAGPVIKKHIHWEIALPYGRGRERLTTAVCNALTEATRLNDDRQVALSATRKWHPEVTEAIESTMPTGMVWAIEDQVFRPLPDGGGVADVAQALRGELTTVRGAQ